MGISKDKYYEICQVTNTEPDPEKVPIDFEDLLYDSQLAIKLLTKLPEQWDGASGYYQGKNLTLLPYMMDLYEVGNKQDFLELILSIENESTRLTNEEVSRKAKRHGK